MVFRLSKLKSRTGYIAYLDILGFRDLLKKSNFGEKASDIVKALEDRTGYDREHHPYLNYLAISDNIIIAAEEGHAADLFWKVSQLQNKLLTLGFCVRGGVAFGDMLIYGNPIQNMFGETLVNAYLLESGTANYPRVVLDNSLVEVIRTELMSKRKSYAESFLLQDRDGVSFVNQFGRDIVNASSKKDAVRKTVQENKRLYAKKIREGLQNEDSKAKMKWHWLDTQYKEQFQNI